MSKKTITSLAILKINSDYGVDYIDNCIPFIVHLINIKGYGEIEHYRLIRDFEQEYGLTIPFHAMVSILRRTKKRGYIYKKDNRLYPKTNQIKRDDFTKKSQEQERKINKLINSFKDYAENEHNCKLSENLCENIILSFINYHDTDILLASEDKSLVPNVKRKRSQVYIFSLFAKSIIEKEPLLFEYLVDLSLGQALADALLFTEIKNYCCDWKGLNCYIDADIVFYLLGVNGLERKQTFCEFIEILKKAKVNVYLFEHNYEEVLRILSSCEKWINNPLFDPEKASRSLLYFISHDFTPSDIKLFIEEVKLALDRYGIEIIEKPHYTGDNKQYNIDEVTLKNVILDTYGFEYELLEDIENNLTINTDIDSISAIYRLRKGRVFYKFSDISHLLITTNSSLAKAAERFERQFSKTPDTISTCLTDVFIGTVLWVGNPQKYRDINKRRFISDVHAALETNDKLLRSYIGEIKKQLENEKISVDEYFLLRSSDVARNLLRDKTFNDPENYQPSLPAEILADIRDKYKEEGLLQYRVLKAEHEETVANLSYKDILLSDKNEQLKEKNKKTDSFIHKFSKFISITSIVVITGILTVSFIYYNINIKYENIYEVVLILLFLLWQLIGEFIGTIPTIEKYIYINFLANI